MGWHRLVWVVGAEAVEPLSDALEEWGAQSVACEAASAEPRFGEPGMEDPRVWEANRIEALFADDDRGALAAQSASLALRSLWGEPVRDYLEDADWGRVWMAQFEPLCFGSRLWVVPSWLEPPDPTALRITLDPGMAFGTGTHATTVLCLEWLVAASPLNDCRILDFGAGSGILALAAARLGASGIHAVDVDPEANRVALENIERNELSTAITVGLPDELAVGPYDILLANILLEPLLQLTERFRALLSPNGELVMSGLLTEQVPALTAHYSARAWRIAAVDEKDGWARVVARPC